MGIISLTIDYSRHILLFCSHRHMTIKMSNSVSEGIDTSFICNTLLKEIRPIELPQERTWNFIVLISTFLRCVYTPVKSKESVLLQDALKLCANLAVIFERQNRRVSSLHWQERRKKNVRTVNKSQILIVTHTNGKRNAYSICQHTYTNMNHTVCWCMRTAS